MPAPAASLNADQRTADLARAREEEFDVVVIGGGITGAGAALDAASRGLSVLLLEAADFAHGTSSKSSKLIHGGLRYLEMLDFALVKEALAERKRLLQTVAPHLVRPVPFVWPLTHAIWERFYMGAGLVMYDTMAGRSAVPLHRHLSRRGFERIAPGFDARKHHGGILFYDAIEDDARMVLTVARTARGRGAAIVTRARVTGLQMEGGAVVGVTATDLLTGQDFATRARHVVSAVGPWTNEIRGMAGMTSDSFRVLPSKGVHIVVPRDRIDAEVGVLMRTEKSVLFIIPWGRYWLIGDTDTKWAQDVSSPVATGADIDYVIEKTNTLLAHPITRADVVGHFAGVRPLVLGDKDQGTTKISREHQVNTPVPGLSLIAGGKYTTYRVMAADLIDAAVGPKGPRSATESLPLVGSEGFFAFHEQVQELARRYGVPTALVEHLAGRFGVETLAVLELISERAELGRPLSADADYIAAEVVYACRHEGVIGLDDMMTRRTRLRIQTADAGRSALDTVLTIMAAELGWGAETTERERAGYLRSVEAEDAALAATTDADAYAIYTESMGIAASDSKAADVSQGIA